MARESESVAAASPSGAANPGLVTMGRGEAYGLRVVWSTAGSRRVGGRPGLEAGKLVILSGG